MKRAAYLASGHIAALFGMIGVFLPLLPTVPLMLLAAFFYGRSSPRLEQRIVNHPKLEPHFAAWRERGAISRSGKMAAVAAFAVSATAALLMAPLPLALVAAIAGAAGGSWILSRPSS